METDAVDTTFLRLKRRVLLRQIGQVELQLATLDPQNADELCDSAAEYIERANYLDAQEHQALA